MTIWMYISHAVAKPLKSCCKILYLLIYLYMYYKMQKRKHIINNSVNYTSSLHLCKIIWQAVRRGKLVYVLVTISNITAPNPSTSLGDFVGIFFFVGGEGHCQCCSWHIFEKVKEISKIKNPEPKMHFIKQKKTPSKIRPQRFDTVLRERRRERTPF